MTALRYDEVRETTEALAAPLSAEDQTVQSMPDASPTTWHRAHTTWFFETLVLNGRLPGYEPFDPAYAYLFNSYYETLGARHPRPHRGLVTRPGVAEVGDYRRSVDKAMGELLERREDPALCGLVELGLNHEQQHQELLLMDIKHLLSFNPLHPVYSPDGLLDGPGAALAPAAGGWRAHPGGVVAMGVDNADERFAFDSEYPRHQALVEGFEVATRLVTGGQWLDFMSDGGYRRPELWMSDGWATVQSLDWQAPMYWEQLDGRWHSFTLAGLHPVDPLDAVCHLSWYEADAFARWAGARLPTEAEWETAAAEPPEAGGADPEGWFGRVWQWTASAYSPYPGFRPSAGALGEYNGKFMVNQQVLRGSSSATSSGHARRTYRNFFPPSARWAFAGLRLCRDAS